MIFVPNDHQFLAFLKFGDAVLENIFFVIVKTTVFHTRTSAHEYFSQSPLKDCRNRGKKMEKKYLILSEDNIIASERERKVGKDVGT